MNTRTVILVLVLAAGLLVVGYAVGVSRHPPAPAAVAPAAAKARWTCSMHPQIQADQPGNCPTCGMKLTPVRSGAGSAAPAPARESGQCH